MDRTPDPTTSEHPHCSLAPGEQRQLTVQGAATASPVASRSASAGPHASDELDSSVQNRLIQVRLGIATSLFVALKARYAPAADHSLRVAVGCSAWCQCQEVPSLQRDEIEVAALLHDIGKIGIPDRVLLKPGKLTPEESATVDRHRLVGEQILLSCCASQNVLDIVRYTPAWYDGSREGFDRRGEELPYGARMIAILEAFDAMTTDQVYRPAMSRERAIAELFEYSGSHFDPELVEQFCDLLATGRIKLTQDAARRWLHELSPDTANTFWGKPESPSWPVDPSVDYLFHQQLLDSMHDGILFVDTQLNILLWNRAAERLTGLSADSVEHRQWYPELIAMADEHGKPVTTESCPLVRTLTTGIQTLRRLVIRDRLGQKRSVDAHAVPVIGRDGIIHGATLLLHDASSQITLEQQVQTLHEKATRDPLTGVANRAEFDRVHTQFIETHFKRRLPCAMIICDIDHFKSVNDTYGHQAGDEVLVRFAELLQQSCRSGDLVARYGGEEFVILCADCDNTTATRRAESIRQKIAGTLHPCLGNQAVTASFGVTQSQPGDTPQTMLRRADRALLQAKSAGRNRVVQFGTGNAEMVKFPPLPSSPGHNVSSQGEYLLLQATLVTSVPVPLARIKWQGFISDHHATIREEFGDTYRIQVVAQPPATCPTRAARPTAFDMAVELKTEAASDRRPESPGSRTIIDVTIKPASRRDRRQKYLLQCAENLLASLKSYFMAQELVRSVPSIHYFEESKRPGAFRNFWARLSRWLPGRRSP